MFGAPIWVILSAATCHNLNLFCDEEIKAGIEKCIAPDGACNQGGNPDYRTCCGDNHGCANFKYTSKGGCNQANPDATPGLCTELNTERAFKCVNLDDAKIFYQSDSAGFLGENGDIIPARRKKRFQVRELFSNGEVREERGDDRHGGNPPVSKRQYVIG